MLAEHITNHRYYAMIRDGASDYDLCDTLEDTLMENMATKQTDPMTPEAREYLQRELGEEWLKEHNFFFLHTIDLQTAMEIAPWLRSLESKPH